MKWGFANCKVYFIHWYCGKSIHIHAFNHSFVLLGISKQYLDASSHHYNTSNEPKPLSSTPKLPCKLSPPPPVEPLQHLPPLLLRTALD
jgi:hypothetical protein